MLCYMNILNQRKLCYIFNTDAFDVNVCIEKKFQFIMQVNVLDVIGGPQER